jgi:hypothetical protein
VLYHETEDDKGANPFTGLKETILHNVGISGEDDVWIGMREWQYTTSSLYGWDCNVYSEALADDWNNPSNVLAERRSYDGTTEHWDKLPMFPLVDGAYDYWIYSTRARVIICVLIGTYYQVLYLGFGRRFGNPVDYAHPAIAAAPAWGNIAYDNSICRSAWRSCAAAWNRLVILPEDTYAEYSDTGVGPRDYVTFDAGQVLAPTLTDQRPLFSPVYIPVPAEGWVLMDLDGLVLSSSNQMAVADDLYAHRKRWVVFREQASTTSFDYAAIAYRDATTTTTSTTSSTSSTTVTTATSVTTESSSSSSSSSSTTQSSVSTASTVSSSSTTSSTVSTASSSSSSSSTTVTPA